MAIRNITEKELTTLDWIQIPRSELDRVDWTDSTKETGWWQIVAEMTCSSCGAFQAADSDPTNDRPMTIKLCLKLFNDVGWRVNDHDCPVCADC